MNSVASSVNIRTRATTPRKPRPVSIAVTGVTQDVKKPEASKPPLPKMRKSSLVKSQEKIKRKSITSPTEVMPKPIVSPTKVKESGNVKNEQPEENGNKTKDEASVG